MDQKAIETDATWNSLLKEFRNFGGTANNIVQLRGEFGLGLFPADPSQPVELRLPQKLLVPADLVDLEQGHIIIKNDSLFPKGYSEWFRRYQRLYSWGADGEISVRAFELGLIRLPRHILSLMEKQKLYNPKRISSNQNQQKDLLRRFLMSRCIGQDGRLMIMPLIELVNHSAKAKNWQIGKDFGISIKGKYDSEIFVKYSHSDPIQRLLRFGFNSYEPMGFSLSLHLKHRNQKISVEGGGGRTWFQPPKIRTKNEIIIIQEPLLGHENFPRLPKTLFRQAAEKIKGLNATELFEQIHKANSLKLLKILRELEGVAGVTAGQLRRGCLDQLVALSHHIGQRPEIASSADRVSKPLNECLNQSEPWENQQ